MHAFTPVFAGLLLVLTAAGCRSTDADTAGETDGGGIFRLDDARTNYRLIDHVQFLPDPAGRLDLAGVTDNRSAPPFINFSSSGEKPRADTWYWGRVQVVNQVAEAERNTEWVLYFSGSWTRLEVYTRGDDGKWRGEPNGSFHPLGKKPFAPTAKGNLVKLSLPPGEMVTVYFRGRSDRPSLPPSFHLYLQTTEAFYDKLVRRKVANAIFIGFIGMMLLYNLIVYFFGRDRSFIYYSGYLLMMILYACYFSDDLPDWLGGILFADYPQYFGLFKLSIFAGLMCYLMFIRSFTDLGHLLPRWDRYLRGVVYLGYPFMALYLWTAFSSNFSYVLEDRLTVPYIAVVVMLCCALVYPLYRTRDRKGAFVVAGILVISLGSLLSLLTRVAFPPLTLGWLKAAIVLEVVIFSLGLAYRQRQLLLARRHADLALRESQLQEEQQRLEADRLRELTDFKSRFYTNITHEFRTPLTVIMGMTEQLTGNAEAKQLILRNGRSLLGLVNQLLDLSRLESGGVHLDWVHGDVVAYLQYLSESFYSTAEQKGIRFMFYSEAGEILMDYDEERLLQVVNNLISNALKFTPSGGKVIVHVSRVEEEGEDALKLIVRDSGIGIPAEHLERIFDRFFQVDRPGAARSAGTGVGLALTRELVGLLGGTISVRSEVGSGTEFRVLLPVRDIYSGAGAATAPAPSAGNHDRSELLVIEDNPDIIAYLQSILADHYHIQFAADGAAGIEQALERVPDVIISDVMMPGRDGFEVCETLKADERTSHVPIILLTARATAEARIEGLRHGADAYLTKPFSKEELMVRLEKLVEGRRQLQQRFAASPGAENGTASPASDAETAFVLRLHDLIHDRLDDASFGVADLAAAANLSPTQLYRKIKAVTGKSPSRFLRSYRLSRAVVLLRRGDLTVAEVAYSVGFSDPSYFSRTFHEEFNQRPSQFVND